MGKEREGKGVGGSWRVWGSDDSHVNCRDVGSRLGDGDGGCRIDGELFASRWCNS